ncbi:MAG: hypothetical protein K5988_11020 [Lachnospiraceae bacterium]|nr:hypothetical protein [Lachnospiraceae bacterium]
MKLKKLLSVSLCSVMVLSLVGCSLNPKDILNGIIHGNANNNNNGGGTNVNIVEEAKKVNKSAVFKQAAEFAPEGFEYVDGLLFANGKYYACSQIYNYPEGYEGGEYETYEGETIENEDIEVEEPDIDETVEPLEEDYSDVDVAQGNATLKIATFTNADDVSYLEIELPTNEYFRSGNGWGVDGEGNLYICTSFYDYENEKETYYLKKYSPQGEEIKNVALVSDKEYFYVGSILVDTEGNVYVVSDSTIDAYDKDLNKNAKGSVSADGEAYISTALFNTKGELCYAMEIWNDAGYDYHFHTVDKDGNVKDNPDLDKMLSGKNIINGKGYDYLYKTASSIKGFNDGDKEPVEICNFYDSDIDPDSMFGYMCFRDAESFACTADNTIALYEKVPEDQVVEKEIITLGSVYGNYSIQRQILKFNKNSDKYRIKLIDYSEYSTPDDWEAGKKRFNTDLTSGNAPDIIVPDPADGINLISKGAMADLTPLMANGNGIKKEDLVYNAQNAFAKDGKLYFVFPTFEVQAIEIKKSNYKDGMTFDDIIAWEQQTGKKAFGEEYTKQDMLNQLMSYSMDAFLDPETGKCNFDSDEFVKILEYSNQYMTEFPEDFWEDYDYDAYTNLYRQDKALINYSYLYTFRDYNWNCNYRFGEETVLLGLPIEGSEGTILRPSALIGISDKCKDKEAAWDFISSCFSDEYYEENQGEFPSLEKKMDEMIELSTQKPFWVDENGNKEYYDENFWIGNTPVAVDPIKKEKALEIKEFVTHVTTTYSWDEELNKIVDEETQGYFEGQKSAKEVAGIIQSRLQIYINEKK